ncbi:MAG: cytoplasmic protein [Clostridium sp.]
MANEHIKAHEYSSNNKSQLEQDEVCGCFYCLSIFNPEEIEEWIDDGEGTAVCPYCGMDSVIGESSEYPITKAFLGKMKDYWF